MILAAQHLYRNGRITGPGAVVIEEGKITAVLDGIPADAGITLPHGILAPGLIDIHNNGAFGIDCAEAGTSDFRILCARLAQSGVTSFAPTIVTAPIPGLHACARRIATARATLRGEPVCAMIGLHLEGPFLSRVRRGAHRADWLRDPDDAALAELLGDATLRGVLRLITIAPELPGALAAIRRFADLGVAVSLGHSDADARTAARGIDAGARLATHVFTAMRPFHHRDPGIAGAALTDRRVAACFIADAVHADPLALNLGFAAAGTRAIAVTDSISLADLADGAERNFGGAPAILRDGAARRPDGTLTGAAITLDEGVRRLIAAGIAPRAALHAATEAPARALDLADRGRLAAGLRADLVWFDDAFYVRNTWIAGAPVQPLPDRPPPRARTLPLTETTRAGLDDLDCRSTETIVDLLLDQEFRAQAALRDAAPALARLTDAIFGKLDAGGRLFYAGAGTSGRLGVLDAAECGPTFSLPPGIVVPIIAGGAAAIAGAVEGAEDDADAPATLLAAHEIGRKDALVGIAASGGTRFTLAAIHAAKSRGALTGCIVNGQGPIAEAADIAVVIATGPEILAGSTRLSAGTAQKIALNTLSTTLMIRLGKSFGPYMVDLRPTNAKLRDRAARIVAAIADCSPETAETALRACDFEAKTAIIMLRLGLDAPAARSRLSDARGRLRAAF